MCKSPLATRASLKYIQMLYHNIYNIDFRCKVICSLLCLSLAFTFIHCITYSSMATLLVEDLFISSSYFQMFHHKSFYIGL